MATPLFWKSWEISNSFYGHILKYPFLVKTNAEKYCFEIEKRSVKLIPLCMC